MIDESRLKDKERILSGVLCTKALIILCLLVSVKSLTTLSIDTVQAVISLNITGSVTLVMFHELPSFQAVSCQLFCLRLYLAFLMFI